MTAKRTAPGPGRHVRGSRSGGPLMAPDGRLLAIVSRNVSNPFNGDAHVTVANGIPPATLTSLIAKDRGGR